MQDFQMASNRKIRISYLFDLIVESPFICKSRPFSNHLQTSGHNLSGVCLRVRESEFAPARPPSPAIPLFESASCYRTCSEGPSQRPFFASDFVAPESVARGGWQGRGAWRLRLSCRFHRPHRLHRLLRRAAISAPISARGCGSSRAWAAG